MADDDKTKTAKVAKVKLTTYVLDNRGALVSIHKGRSKAQVVTQLAKDSEK